MLAQIELRFLPCVHRSCVKGKPGGLAAPHLHDRVNRLADTGLDAGPVGGLHRRVGDQFRAHAGGDDAAAEPLGETGLVGVLDESAPSAGCIGLSGASAGVPLELFNRTDIEPWVAYVGAPDNGSVKIGADLNAVITEGSISVCATDINVQQDARRVTWAGDGPARFFLENPAGGSDLSGYLNSASAVVFDVIVHQPPHASQLSQGAEVANRSQKRIHRFSILFIHRLPGGKRRDVDTDQCPFQLLPRRAGSDVESSGRRIRYRQLPGKEVGARLQTRRRKYPHLPVEKCCHLGRCALHRRR